jgi:hypothetical protein
MPFEIFSSDGGCFLLSRTIRNLDNNALTHLAADSFAGLTSLTTL